MLVQRKVQISFAGSWTIIFPTKLMYLHVISNDAAGMIDNTITVHAICAEPKLIEYTHEKYK